MKIRMLLLSFFMVLSGLIYAQKTEKETDFALAFNDYCAQMTDSLFTYGSSWGEAFGRAYEVKNFTLLTPHTTRILSYIDRTQKALIKRKVNTDMEDLKVAMLDFLAYEKAMVQEAFKPFEKFTDKTSEETIQAQLNLLTDKSSQEGQILNTVRDQQHKLAQLYDYTIATEEEE